MKNNNSIELMSQIDSILTKNRDSFSEQDIQTLKDCKKRLQETDDLKVKGNYELRNKVIIEVTTSLLKFFFSEI